MGAIEMRIYGIVPGEGPQVCKMCIRDRGHGFSSPAGATGRTAAGERGASGG